MKSYEMFVDAVWHSLRPLDLDGDHYLTEHDREVVRIIDLGELEQLIGEFAVHPKEGTTNKYRMKLMKELMDYLYNEFYE